MPHLAPISWPAAFLAFWLLLTLLSSLLWWLQLPTFPALLPPGPTQTLSPWAWE